MSVQSDPMNGQDTAEGVMRHLDTGPPRGPGCVWTLQNSGNADRNLFSACDLFPRMFYQGNLKSLGRRPDLHVLCIS